MKWKDVPNPSEPLDSLRREAAVLRAFKYIEDSKDIPEQDKAEFLYCMYACIHKWDLNNSAPSVLILERAGRKFFSKR